MTMNKQEKEYVEMTAKLTAHECIKEFKKTLDCNNHDERISTNEQILNDGLRSDVKNIKRWFMWTILSVVIIIIGSLISNIFI